MLKKPQQSSDVNNNFDCDKSSYKSVRLRIKRRGVVKCESKFLILSHECSGKYMKVFFFYSNPSKIVFAPLFFLNKKIMSMRTEENRTEIANNFLSRLSQLKSVKIT